jgi:hypothetical protein
MRGSRTIRRFSARQGGRQTRSSGGGSRLELALPSCSRGEPPGSTDLTLSDLAGTPSPPNRSDRMRVIERSRGGAHSSLLTSTEGMSTERRCVMLDGLQPRSAPNMDPSQLKVGILSAHTEREKKLEKQAADRRGHRARGRRDDRELPALRVGVLETGRALFQDDDNDVPVLVEVDAVMPRVGKFVESGVWCCSAWLPKGSTRRPALRPSRRPRAR